jgi:HAMP domain-containing protein
MSAYPYHGTYQGAPTVWAFVLVAILIALVVGWYIWRRP